MYAITGTLPNQRLKTYLKSPQVFSIQFVDDNGKQPYYTMNGKRHSGLHSKLKATYYPNYERKKRRFSKSIHRAKKASSKELGKTIDRQIVLYIKKPEKKPRNPLARALVEYWLKIEHSIQAAQVPVYIKELNCVTQADVITEDKFGRLWMWEVKSGYNRAQKQGFLLGFGKEEVPNKDTNHWELQRHFTHKGLVDGGLPLFASHVINVYQNGDEIEVKKRKVPKWVLNK